MRKVRNAVFDWLFDCRPGAVGFPAVYGAFFAGFLAAKASVWWVGALSILLSAIASLFLAAVLARMDISEGRLTSLHSGEGEG